MRRLGPLLLSVLLAALIPLAPAAAQAAPGRTLTVAPITVSPGGPEKLAHIVFNAPASNPVPAFQMVIDLTEADPLVDFQLSDGCARAGVLITCQALRGTWFERNMRVTAKPGATPGATAALPVRAVAGGELLASATGRVVIAEGVSLAAVQLQDDVQVATGAEAGLLAGVRNTGDTAVTGLVLQVNAGRGFAPRPYRNCAPVEFGVVCHFAGTLAPGAEQRLSEPLRVRATDQIWAPSSRLRASSGWSTEQGYLDSGASLPAGGAGPELTLDGVAAARVPQTDTGNGDNTDPFLLEVTGVNRSNVTARGADVRATVGETVAVTVSARNNGPARIEGYGSERGTYLTVTLTPPPGVKVVAVPKLCQPWNISSPVPPPWGPGAHADDGKFYCFAGQSENWRWDIGQRVDWTFKLKAEKPGTHRGDLHAVVVGPPGVGGDTNPADDRGPIVIRAAAAAPAPGDSGGGGGSLPITGANVVVVAAIGALLLLAGAVALVVTRRRP